MANFSLLANIALNSSHPLHNQMKEASFLWCSSLGLPDPYMILPITSALVMFANFKLTLHKSPGEPPNPFEKYGKMFMFFPIISIPF